MQHYSSSAFTDIGKPAGGASITVKIAGTLTNATIFSDDGVTPKSNPFTANSLGQFDFYAASGKYDITISGTQITTYTQTNQVVFDPFEQSAADTGVLLRSLSLVTPFSFSTGLTVPSGQVLNADQVMPFNSFQTGGFWGMGITFPSFIGTPPANVIVAAANEVRVFQFVLPFAATIGKLNVQVSQFSTGTSDIGLYNASGTRVANTGGFLTGSAGMVFPSIVGGPMTLPAGVYYLAQTSTSTIATLISYGTSIGLFSNSVGTGRWGVAFNSAVAGVLPSTMGNPALVSVNFGVPPALVFFER